MCSLSPLLYGLGVLSNSKDIRLCIRLLVLPKLVVHVSCSSWFKISHLLILHNLTPSSEAVMCVPETDLLGHHALFFGLRVRDPLEHIETLRTLSMLAASDKVRSFSYT